MPLKWSCCTTIPVSDERRNVRDHAGKWYVDKVWSAPAQ